MKKYGKGGNQATLVTLSSQRWVKNPCQRSKKLRLGKQGSKRQECPQAWLQSKAVNWRSEPSGPVLGRQLEHLLPLEQQLPERQEMADLVEHQRPRQHEAQQQMGKED